MHFGCINCPLFPPPKLMRVDYHQGDMAENVLIAAPSYLLVNEPSPPAAQFSSTARTFASWIAVLASSNLAV